MTTTTPPAPAARRGFTLIELLVVISLIAVLAALSAGVFFRVRAGMNTSTTEATATKLNAQLDARWTKVLEDAKSDLKNNRIPNQSVLRDFACGDDERLLVVYTYLKLKSEFPTTFAEATTNAGVIPPMASPPAASPFPSGYPGIPRKQIFVDFVAKAPAPPAGSEDKQSAALFYVAVNQTGGGGVTTGGDGLTNQTGTVELAPGGVPVTVYTDAWGQPFAFARMGFGAEINNPQFSKGGPNRRDPLDPLGKLTAFDAAATPKANKWDAARLAALWQAVRLNHIAYPALPPASNGYNANNNWVPTLVSFGPNKQPGALLDAPSGDPGEDNIPSYRLRQQGARSN